MKIKRILSTALTVVLLLTTVMSVAPVQASAMHSAVIDGTSNYTADEIKANILTPMLSYNYDSADDMLAAELEAGYLDYISSSDKRYTLYANRYTGVVYYVNNVTGQILTTNPSNPAYANLDEDIRKNLMSQVYIDFSTVGSIVASTNYNSYDWSASYGQISVAPIESGLRVNYALGDTSLRFLLPECVPADSFEEDIIIPAIQTIERLIVEACTDPNRVPDFEYLDADGNIPASQRDSYDKVDTNKLKRYLQNLSSKATSYCSAADAEELAQLCTDAITLLTVNYTLLNPGKYDPVNDKDKLDDWAEKYPATAEGVAVYAVSETIKNDEQGYQKRQGANRLRTLCPAYTFSMMYEAENICGITVKSIDKPLFRCAIEYSFNADGTLSVSLPANSITYDETVYVINSIIINKFFGCGDMLEDGYIFYPDGSGTVVQFSDFYSNVNSERQNVSLTGMVYGIDYAYSKITGAHRENVTMPVYGMVTNGASTEITAMITGNEKTSGGFFAIMEEGESLSKLSIVTGGSSHKFATVYPIYQPYASDTFDLSSTLSVSGLTAYTIFASERYTGSYRLRVKMLNDPSLSLIAGDEYCEASYVGMATFYRNYLKDAGVLTKLENVKNDLPLYIEALGSMEITTKFLTFPVNTAIALTKFEDIKTMYDEFADAVNKLKLKVDEYKALAEAETRDVILKNKYAERAAEYERLVGEVQNITNINFKLNGFANGGVKSLYPTSVRWEAACGGDEGFAALISYAESKNSDTENFGVFPDFDFLYINHTGLFDGVSNQWHAALMIDNRYASKQVYNHVTRTFESFFTMVIATETLGDLYTSFDNSYSKVGTNKLSASTMGSDLNSNFNVEDLIDREESKANVTAVLDRMVRDDGYELMVSTGNAYALKYATHIIDAPIDSSHFRYSSYSVPFLGMVLHSYVSYTGGALNYAGSTEYEILRSIENGASLYYILCFDNTNYMKDDKELSKYFGVDYKNWFDSIVDSYSELNATIGRLQLYDITDHDVLFAERKLDSEEKLQVLGRLGAEFIDFADKQVYAKINAAFDEMITDPANNGRGIKVDIDMDALIEQALVLFNTDRDTLFATDFDEKLTALVAGYEQKYSGQGSNGTPYAVDFDTVIYDDEAYKTAYDYVTTSVAADKNYETTDFTCDLGNVVMVTYTSETGDVVTFILNYNIYDVEVRLEDGSVITLGKYEYKEI